MRSQRWFLRVLILLMSLCFLVGVAAKPTITHAASQPKKGDVTLLPKRAGSAPLISAPSSTTSYYESTTSVGTLQNQGCSAARGAGGVIVLDFGEPALVSGTYGTYLFGSGGFASDTTLFHAAANFIYGAWNCRTSATNLALALGTSNYYGNLGGASNATWYTAGQQWGDLVNNAQNYSVSNGYDAQIGAYGADDIETEWASYGQSSNFVNGYNNTSARIFLDYGDDTPGYWTNAQVWYVAFGAPDNYPLPEIYYNADATQDWEPLSAWACSNEGGPIDFKGTMSEYPTGNTPAQAWTDMYNAEGTNSCTAAARSFLIFSTNI